MLAECRALSWWGGGVEWRKAVWEVGSEIQEESGHGERMWSNLGIRFGDILSRLICLSDRTLETRNQQPPELGKIQSDAN